MLPQLRSFRKIAKLRSVIRSTFELGSIPIQIQTITATAKSLTRRLVHNLYIGAD